jgi:hypothetical protein
MPDDAPAPCPPTPSSGDLLARRLGETAALSPLWQRARLLGLGRPRDLLAVAVDRGARHYGGGAPAPEASLAASRVLTDDELIVLLLHGRNPFEPLLIRAAAELLRRRPLDPHLLAKAARRERCERVLAYIAAAGVEHDPSGSEFWRALQTALGRQRAIPSGILPHWSRFVALLGVDRQSRPRGNRWIGAPA